MDEPVWTEVLRWKAIGASFNSSIAFSLSLLPLTSVLNSRDLSAIAIVTLLLASLVPLIASSLTFQPCPPIRRYFLPPVRPLLGYAVTVLSAALSGRALALLEPTLSPALASFAGVISASCAALVHHSFSGHLLHFPLLQRSRWNSVRDAFALSLLRAFLSFPLVLLLTTASCDATLPDTYSLTKLALFQLYVFLAVSVGLSAAAVVLPERKRFCETHEHGLNAALTSLQQRAPLSIQHLAMIDLANQAELCGPGAKDVFADSTGKLWRLTTESALDPLRHIADALYDVRQARQKHNERRHCRTRSIVARLLSKSASKSPQGRVAEAANRVQSLRVLARNGVQAVALLSANAHVLDSYGVSRLQRPTAKEILTTMASALCRLTQLSVRTPKHGLQRHQVHDDLTDVLRSAKPAIDELKRVCEQCIFWMLESGRVPAQIESRGLAGNCAEEETQAVVSAIYSACESR